MDLRDPLRREEREQPAPERRESGPSQPDVSRPGRDNILKRMKRVDPKQSEKYRQRTGQ
ncbi:MAG: ubiquitin-like protein UBact [Nitrospinales bacterium]